jgi:hypothetical protein
MKECYGIEIAYDPGLFTNDENNYQLKTISGIIPAL